jgi:hypothetical protein
MASTRRDPVTGEIVFKDDNQIINTTTGQTASGVAPGGTVQNTAALTPSGGTSVGFGETFQEPAPVVAPFTTEADRNVDVTKGDEANTTDDVLDLRDDLDTTATGVQGQLESGQQAILDAQNAFNEEITNARGTLDDIQATRMRLRGELQQTQDKSEDRLVDIGTIRGEQAQAQRQASGLDIELSIREQRAINKLNSYITLRGQDIDAATKSYEFTKDNIAAMTALTEATKPDVISTEIDKVTGDIIAVIQNPDGTTTSEIVGTLSPEVADLKFAESHTWDSNGRETFWGITTDGKVISQDLGPSKKKDGITSTDVGDFNSLVDNASLLLGSERGKASKVALANAIADENWASAYAQVANNVESSLTGEVKTKFANSRTDYGIMIGMKNAIEAYVAGGGDIGLLKGKAEKLAQNFGQLANDPEFAALGAQLQREFQTYRLNMTGAAFSPEESREYALVNPRTDASLDLNLAIIKGALNQLETRITSTVDARLPGAEELYGKVTGVSDGLSDDDAYQEYLKMTNQ